MKTRLVFVCGLAELFTCSLIMEFAIPSKDFRNFLVVYGQGISMPLLHVKDTLKFASIFGSWEEIIDLTPVTDMVARSSSLKDASLILEQQTALFAAADQVLIHTLWKTAEKVFLDLCPSAEIILFDNGLDSHLPRDIDDTPGSLKPTAVRVDHIARTTFCCYTLGDFLPIPKFAESRTIVVPSGLDILNHLQLLGRRGGFSAVDDCLPRQDAVYALCIGTSFFRTKMISKEEEEAAYRMYCSMERKGQPVLFKEHPRSPAAVWTSQLENVVHFRSSIPIEFIPLCRKVAVTASISSSALLSLKKIFGIPYRLIGHELAERLRLKWMTDLRSQESLAFPLANDTMRAAP